MHRQAMRWAAVGWAALAGATALAGAGPKTVLLNEQGLWRYHVTLRKPTVGEEVLPVRVAYRHYPGIEHVETPGPPDDWRACDLDDADWPRARAAAGAPGSISDTAFAPAVRFSAARVCLRGKFLVTDPAAVGALELSMGYRGGVVVYLNGREIARGHVPASEVDANTPAEAYPADAFVDEAGKLIPDDWNAGKRIKAGEKDLARRLALRDRRLGPVAVPASALRRGVNVLAVELRRAPYHEAAKLWFRDPYFQKNPAWTLSGLSKLSLVAAGDGARPNVARPEGVQVWNHDLNDRVCVLDYGDPCEGLRPVSIVAARNGAYSAQVVVGSNEPLRGLKAVAGPLKAAGGGRDVDARHVRVRYGRLDGAAYGRPDWFDGLVDAPPAEVPLHKTGGAVQPVWLTVRVPADAAPGEYRGELTISVEGAAGVAVPVHLSVADWALPEPKDFRTYVGVYQSPTSLALQYKVPEWSEAHWRLMERSFELLGQLGNKLVNVPISDRTQFGNDEGMVYWVRKADGSFEHDYRVFDRYLALVRKHLPSPDFVALHVWHSGGWDARKATQPNTVTVVDAATGRREPMQVPPFGTEAGKRFWQPVLDALRKRLTDAGLEQAMCLGILSDGTAPPAVFTAFDQITPGGAARWTRGCHTATRETQPYPLKGGGVVVCHEHCYGMSMADPAEGLPPIWTYRTRPAVAFIRHNFDDRLSLLKYRTMAERALYCGTRGIGRIGLDFWDVTADAQGRPRNIYNRWPHSSCAQREPNLFRLAGAGPDGPIATVRFEQFRQGVQDTEATVFLSRAVGEQAEKLGADLADECRRLLIDRMRYCRRGAPEISGTFYFRSYHLGWRDLARRTYDLAAKASRKLALPGRG